MKKLVQIGLLTAWLGCGTLLTVPCLTWAAEADTVYQFYDEDGTLIITNRPQDLPSGRSAKIVVSRYEIPTGRSPVPPAPSTVTVLAKLRAPASPAPPEAARFRYYQVCGGTAAEALHETRTRGPFDPAEGKRFSGQTRWSLGWSYNYTYKTEPRERGLIKVTAEVYDVNIYTDVDVLLPALTESCRLPPIEQHLWDQAMTSLREHEMDHVNLVLNEDALRSMADSIAGVRQYEFPAGTVTDGAIRRSLENDTHAAGMPWIKWLKQINDEYDRVTEHGLKPELRQKFLDSVL